MKKIKVNLGPRSYDIIIGSNILKYLGVYLKRLNVPRDIFIITNKNIKGKYAGTIKQALRKSGYSCKFYTTIDSEKAKSIDNALRLIEILAEYAGQKKIAILAFGGGVVGDLASFIASIYKRGVPLIHVPTTLLAQVDSAIGGKTAIDLKIAKNLVGTFYQPRVVFCEINFLKSLDRKQIRSGLAEIIKYAFIKDENLLRFLESSYQLIFKNDIKALERIVSECAKIKAGFVELDEKEEKGIRTLLNFGHTIGHAVETAGGYARYNHGEAISIGMLCAAKISLKMDLLDSEICQRLTDMIIKTGLPQEISGIKEKELIKAYKLDKKFVGKTNRFVLLKKIGRPVIYENVPQNIIHSAIRELFISSAS